MEIHYDAMWNPSGVILPDGGETHYRYDKNNRLESIEDAAGHVVSYTYDGNGNRTSERNQLGDVIQFTYDAAGRLVHVQGEEGAEMSYAYDAEDALGEETYAYDKRGNLNLILENGALKNRYTYGALNRLEQAVKENGEAASYLYNGLGHRVGKDIGPETKIRYTIDLTKSYHNLLQKEEETAVQTYLWDGNVAGMWEDTGTPADRTAGRHAYSAALRYYLQDELGSPIRLFGKEGGLEESYGYDEFGQDLYGNQGLLQPFGYTGYQADQTAGTYYAQSREYRAELGRFAAVDIVKGSVIIPYTLNEYGYCWGSPLVFVDLNGAWPKWAEDVVKVGATFLFAAAAVGITVATFGTGAGIVVAAAAIIGGTIGGVSSVQSGDNVADGIMRGSTLATTAAVSIVASPMGAGLGFFCQLSTDLTQNQISSPETYTGAMLGGAIGMSTGNAAIGAAVATSTGEMLENVNGVKKHNLRDILVDAVSTGLLAEGFHKFMPAIEWDLDYYMKKVLTDYERNWIESIVSGVFNGIYFEIKEYLDNSYSVYYEGRACI